MPAAELQHNMTASLIALDWGTSSLRAYLMDAGGRVLATRRLPWGIMHLPPAPSGTTESAPEDAFERAFDAACGDWLQVDPDLPVLACGMVGSAQGWREAPYVELPTQLDALARQLVRVDRGVSAPIHIVPGLIQRTALPNVMRGEETQAMGVLAALLHEQAQDDLLIVLPGTHCKWISVRAGEVHHFFTFMTGEVYAALCNHTLLGKTMQAGEAQDDAFARGLAVTSTEAGEVGLLGTIFSSRTLGLTGALSGAEQAEYLSGLLVGHEVAAVASLMRRQSRTPQLMLCGEADLCRRYASALEFNGFAAPQLAAGATERGLWQLAVASGLIFPAKPGPVQ